MTFTDERHARRHAAVHVARAVGRRRRRSPERPVGGRHHVLARADRRAPGRHDRTPDKLKERLCATRRRRCRASAPRDPRLPRELVAIVDKCLREAEERALPDRDRAARRPPGVPRAARATAPPRTSCPYRGLAAFGEDDAKYFFGRSNEIRTALAQLDELAAARGDRPVGRRQVVVRPRRPGARGARRAAAPGRSACCARAASRCTASPNVLEDTLATGEHPRRRDEQARRGARSVRHDAAAHAAARRNHRVLSSSTSSRSCSRCATATDGAHAFLAALLAAADDPSSPVRVVLSMRADFLDRLAGHKHFLAELSRGLFFLTAPDQENLRETLVRPAELAGYTFEDRGDRRRHDAARATSRARCRCCRSPRRGCGTRAIASASC